MAIADPDQIEAYSRLNLSASQKGQIESIAKGYLPRAKKFQRHPRMALTLLPAFMAEVDAVLTPAQRPLARRLLPRPHQWEAIRNLLSSHH
jgi:hypothetical protein